jgi:Flagellar basal-body P-ring protein
MYHRLIIFLLLINLSLWGQETPNLNITYQTSYNYKLKDVVRILGYKNNQLVGYGIVVGLNGTGDTKHRISRQILNKILNKFNININLENYETKNIASVLVTAEIPPFSKKGDRITCYVSSMEMQNRFKMEF